MRELGCTAQQPAVFGLSTFGISHLEIWVRRAVPAMVALFAGALVAISLVITRDAYDRALTDAFTDLELSAAPSAETSIRRFGSSRNQIWRRLWRRRCRPAPWRAASR